MARSNSFIHSQHIYSLYGFDDFFHNRQLVSAPRIQKEKQIFILTPLVIASTRLPPANQIMNQVRSIVEPAATTFILACVSVMVVKHILGFGQK